MLGALRYRLTRGSRADGAVLFWLALSAEPREVSCSAARLIAWARATSVSAVDSGGESCENVVMADWACQQRDFVQAMGEEFGAAVSPPVPWEDASAHECCQAVWRALGPQVTPAILASIDAGELERLAEAFGGYFECERPSVAALERAVAGVLARWPAADSGTGMADGR